MSGRLSLRLTLYSLGTSDAVEVSFEQPGRAREAVKAPFDWRPSDQDQERLRWYFEDYLQFPAEPAPTLAAGVETRMAELGKELFRSTFATEDAVDLWSRVRPRLDMVDVEVLSEAGSISALPWELLWDPRTDVPVAVRAASFTRGYSNPAQPPRPPASGERQVRILLAICRPGRDDDVPFRSVASRLVKGLGGHEQAVRLDVLRPPTFARLTEALRIAAESEPYHIVHFDGHGAFRQGADGSARGCLVFEDEASEHGLELIDGSQIGKVLAETGVSFLILNACRSAHAEPTLQPGGAETRDAHARVRAYGSLALEAMDAGVTGVVAMRYNVYVSTAAQFVGDLYATLGRGQTLGRAASLGRKQLYEQPARGSGEWRLELRDWPVPVVYEAAAVPIFPKLDADESFVTLDIGETGATPVRGWVDPNLPDAPDAGFYGRDDTLLAIDRAFDNERIVLLHAYAGSGKTAVAAEFARWYTLTGGNRGPVLFTSFEHYVPLARVLDDFAASFGPVLERAGVQWLSLSDAQRRRVALEALSQIPTLWIWDNVEPVAGFPAGAESSWTSEEQQELLSFLRELRSTKARVLITSRRDERKWLGELPARITMPGMPTQERVELARAIARKLGSPIRSLDAWRALLDYTRGNPLTITVVVGEAVRQGFVEPQQFERYVAELTNGVAALSDDEEQGRSLSLSASLSYGFREAFNDRDRERLALLFLFDGEVADFLLATMGNLGERSVECLAQAGVAEVRALLDRAAEIGHLTKIGPGLYTIHPALPAYFAELFERYHADDEPRPTRAYCEAMATFSSYRANLGPRSDREIALLRAFESNILHARRLARSNGWRRVEIALMGGLHFVYEHEGRWTAWSRLLDGTADGVVDATSNLPIAGLEDEWDQVTQWRVRLAFARGKASEAVALQQLLVERKVPDAERAEAAGADDASARGLYGQAAIALSELGQAYGAIPGADAIPTAARALRFAELSHDRSLEAMLSYNLAAITLKLRGIERWERCKALLERALELFDPDDDLSRSRCYAELGFIALGRAEAESDQTARRTHLLVAIDAYEHALALTPANAKESLAMKHANLGAVYLEVGNADDARRHCDAAIPLAESTGQTQVAGVARSRIAVLLSHAGDHTAAALFASRSLEDLAAVEGPPASVVNEMMAIVARARALGAGA